MLDKYENFFHKNKFFTWRYAKAKILKVSSSEWKIVLLKTKNYHSMLDKTKFSKRYFTCKLMCVYQNQHKRILIK